MSNICESCRHYNSEISTCSLGESVFTACSNNSCKRLSINSEDSPEFKRDFYAQLVKSVFRHDVTFLLGPRHCGKTYAMKQMNRSMKDTKYINIKLSNSSQEDMLSLLDEIRSSHINNHNMVYLIDEVTYFFSPEQFIASLYEIFNFSDSNNTHVVLTGSQSAALRYWEGKYFCGCCGVIDVDFLNYSEWLRYRCYDFPTEMNYFEYLMGVQEFYKLGSVETYLQGCIDETIQSNLKAYTNIRNNSTEGLTVDILLDVLFCSLVNIHLGVRYTTFVNRNQLEAQIKHYFSKYYTNAVQQRLAEVIARRYSNLIGIGRSTLRNALVFLYRNSLIGFTWIGTQLEHTHIDNDIMSDNFPEFTRDDNGLFTNYKQDLFDSLGVFIRHPMFYLALLQLVFKEDMPEDIPKDLLGDIVECHVRSLLPCAHQYVFHDPTTDREIDYVNDEYALAVEITVSDKHGTCFELLPDGYRNILLTRTKTDVSDRFTRIPYYKYIHHLSEGRDPVLN